MQFELAQNDQDFADSFRKFCDAEIAPHAADIDEKGCIPKVQYQKLGEVGYLGLLHGEKFGGQGAGNLQAILAQELLAEACGSTFFSGGASSGLFGGPIEEFGSLEQKLRYLPDIIKGETIGCLAVTEPDAGSDVSGLRTTAVQKGDEIFLNGQKTYITNAPICDYALVLARYTDKSGRDYGLTHFIVDAKSEGLSRGKSMKKMGLRGSPTGEIFLEDVRVTEADILGKPGQGFRYTMDTFARERLALTAYSCGVMAACLADSKKYAKTRKSFGRPIGKHQSVAFMLADMLVRYDSSRLLMLETAWMMDKFEAQTENGRGKRRMMHNGHPVDMSTKAAVAKLHASTAAREVTNLAVQLHGGAGYMEEYRVARMYRDIKLAEIGGGTSEIQKGIIARGEAKRVKA